MSPSITEVESSSSSSFRVTLLPKVIFREPRVKD
jgi:hypothetical protein